MKPEPTIRIEDARDDLPFQIHWELDDAPLTVDAFRVYAHLVRCHGRNGLIFPSYQSIGEKCFRASVGPKANPRSLRNRAMKAMRELVEAGLVGKEARSRKGKQESDSNLYTLTPKRAWLDEMIRRRRVLEAAIEGDPVAVEEIGGGIPTMPPSIPAMPRGIPTMPKGISIEVLQEKKRGVQDLESDPREGGQPSTPVVEPSSPEHSSSKNEAAPQNPTHEGGPLALTLGVTLAPVASVPAAAVLASPDGVAADAAGQVTLPDSQDLDEPQVGMTEQATSLENVPAAAGPVGGAAADGPRDAENGAGRAGVDAVRPVDPQELAARPVALPESPVYKSLRSLVGNGLGAMLKETTRTGGLSRALWLQLDEGEIGLVRSLAQADAKATGGNMITLAVRGLDHLIGALSPKKTAKAKGAAPRLDGIEGPKKLDHLDPQLVPGQRCTVQGALGVVRSATNANYVVKRDDGELVTVDRHLALHLQSLLPSDAPLPAAPATEVRDDVVVLAPEGSQWRPRKGGEVVTVVEVRGGNRVLSSGKVLADFLLVSGFEKVLA